MIICNYCQFFLFEFNDEESNSDLQLVIQRTTWSHRKKRPQTKIKFLKIK